MSPITRLALKAWELPSLARPLVTLLLRVLHHGLPAIELDYSNGKRSTRVLLANSPITLQAALSNAHAGSLFVRPAVIARKCLVYLDDGLDRIGHG
jgi:hypothetical protein